MQNVHALRAEVREEYLAARDRLTDAGFGADLVFAARLERFFTELRDPFVAIYGSGDDASAAFAALLDTIAAAATSRDPVLRALDHEREITPDWLRREQAIGYVAYVDRFAGTLTGVRERIGYLRELGVTYLHLMPLLRARPEPNDGGYAVADYGQVEPALGDTEDLRALAAELHGAGMSLCIDVVLNHTAAEHPWTREHPDWYRTFPDRTEPDAYERTLPEIFPETAPGSFTEVDGRWVWTTFNTFQWDLDWSNPAVFVALASAMLELAALGVDVMRLDAVPFLWKRLGTNCQNQPEVHDLLQALRAVFRIAAPGVAFKAEAIVGPRDLVPYLGVGRHEGKECDLAYHNVFMVLLWSSLASARAGLLTSALQAFPAPPPDAGWVTYVRCHDDIGWAITDEDAARVGESAHLHRRFLADFYAGEFPGSFARGARFQYEPATGEARSCGTTASLAGLQSARDPVAVELAVRRVLLLYALAFAHGGLPLIYMGDELGLLNDPAGARVSDNRWMHRPVMDWDLAARRGDPSSVEGRLFAGLQRLATVRGSTRAAHGDARSTPVWTGNEHVFGLVRERAGERLRLIANLSADVQPVVVEAPDDAARPDGRPLQRDGRGVALAPYQHLWILD